MPETDVAAQLFSKFKTMYGMFTRATQEVALKAQMKENKTRVDRTDEPGELVFRKMPIGARMSKHLLPPPASGPYYVASQPNRTSVVLRKEDGELLDKGVYIPLDQVLAGPQRAQLKWSEEAECPERSISQMLSADVTGSGPLRSGFSASKTKGLALTTICPFRFSNLRLSGVSPCH